jgi:hypothetical protein
MTGLRGRWLPLTVLVAAVATLLASNVWVAGRDFGRPGPTAMMGSVSRDGPVRSLDDADRAAGRFADRWGLRVGEDLDREESGEVGGDPALPDTGLVVPDRHFRHRIPAGQQLPVTVDQIARHPARQHPRGDDPRIARDHHQHRWPPGLAIAERDVEGWEPQVALSQLAGLIGGARDRIDGEVGGPFPADPLRDHCRRHRRGLFQQLTDLRFDRVYRRALQRPGVHRRPVGGQRPLHGVLRDAQMPCDRPDRHLLGPVQPADLCPVLHLDHPLLPISNQDQVGMDATK